LYWVGSGWASQLIGWVGSGHTKLTHGQLCLTSPAAVGCDLTLPCEVYFNQRVCQSVSPLALLKKRMPKLQEICCEIFCSSAFLRRQCNVKTFVLYTPDFVDGVVFSHNGASMGIQGMRIGRMLKVTHQGQHGFDTAEKKSDIIDCFVGQLFSSGIQLYRPYTVRIKLQRLTSDRPTIVLW